MSVEVIFKAIFLNLIYRHTTNEDSDLHKFILLGALSSRGILKFLRISELGMFSGCIWPLDLRFFFSQSGFSIFLLKMPK